MNHAMRTTLGAHYLIRGKETQKTTFNPVTCIKHSVSLRVEQKVAVK